MRNNRRVVVSESEIAESSVLAALALCLVFLLGLGLLAIGGDSVSLVELDPADIYADPEPAPLSDAELLECDRWADLCWWLVRRGLGLHQAWRVANELMGDEPWRLSVRCAP